MNNLVRITEPVIAININQTYRFGLSTADLYDFTRGIWSLSRERAENAKYAYSVFQGVIKEVYEFVGKIASEIIREKYVGKMMPKMHRQNPIKYYNC